MKNNLSQQCGLLAEELAADYLIKQGLTCLAKNYFCRWGEIDLIMQEPPYLVFVEVRWRRSNAFGGALASINHGKRQKLLKTAVHYLSLHGKNVKCPMRFDAVILQGLPPSIDWVKNAFENIF